MRALIKGEAAEGLWLENVPEPEIGINDVLIRVRKTGICGTDLHIYGWDAWAQKRIQVTMVFGHGFCGAVPMTNIWTHWAGIDEEVASIFDPFGNAVHTALSFPVLGEDVLVTGAGPIGIMAAVVARFSGARHVVITDVNPNRLKLAEKAGIPITVDSRTTRLKEVQKRLEMREGFDVGLEMSGSPDAFREMLNNMCHGGKIAMLGIPSGEVAIDWSRVIFNMLTIKGIYGREMFETWYKMTVMIESGLDISPIITHRFSWREYEKGFEVMRSGEAGKVILDWRSVG